VEANKYAAGNWKRAHAPQGVLRWLERYHRWARGGDSAKSVATPEAARPVTRGQA